MSNPSDWDEPGSSQRHTRQYRTPERWGRPWRETDGIDHPVTVRYAEPSSPSEHVA